MTCKECNQSCGDSCGITIKNCGPQCDPFTYLNQCGKQIKFVAISPAILVLSEDKQRMYVGMNFHETEDQFVATNGQNAVTITKLPLPGSKVKVFRNGLKLREPADFSVLGNTVSFVSALAGGDKIDVLYFSET